MFAYLRSLVTGIPKTHVSGFECPCPTSELLANFNDLADLTSRSNRRGPGYDVRRFQLIDKIKKNLEDGADPHSPSNNPNNDLFQMACVLDQEEVIMAMLPHVRHHPPFWANNLMPFLVWCYHFRGPGGLNSGLMVERPSFSISSYIYQEYYTKYATLQEKMELDQYRRNPSMYDKTPENMEKWMAKY